MKSGDRKTLLRCRVIEDIRSNESREEMYWPELKWHYQLMPAQCEGEIISHEWTIPGEEAVRIALPTGWEII